VSFVLFDLTNVLVFTIPGALLFGTGLEDAVKMFVGIPEVETLSVEHIVFVVTEVVLFVLKYLESQTVSSAIKEHTVVDVSVDPNPLMA
jgi:hypothetical protein